MKITFNYDYHPYKLGQEIDSKEIDQNALDFFLTNGIAKKCCEGASKDCGCNKKTKEIK